MKMSFLDKIKDVMIVCQVLWRQYKTDAKMMVDIT